MKLTYLLVNVLSAIVPFAFSFHPKINFSKYFIPFIKANVIVSLLFLAWDAGFTAKGVWHFNERYTLGINIYNLPLEEVMFFVCIPFACVFTFHCFRTFFHLQWNKPAAAVFIPFLAFVLLAAGLLFHHKAYTASTFISTALLLLVFYYYFKTAWLTEFLTVYPFLLIPFFMVNGILTGTGLEQPVVGYNNEENLGVRLLTIPVEDVVYGFELLVLNVFFYERFRLAMEPK